MMCFLYLWLVEKLFVQIIEKKIFKSVNVNEIGDYNLLWFLDKRKVENFDTVCGDRALEVSCFFVESNLFRQTNSQRFLDSTCETLFFFKLPRQKDFFSERRNYYQAAGRPTISCYLGSNNNYMQSNYIFPNVITTSRKIDSYHLSVWNDANN